MTAIELGQLALFLTPGLMLSVIVLVTFAKGG
jgi:hypothetical protein